jgi:hypothetical protein
MAVSYHELDRPSLLERLFRWLTPNADGKVTEGPVREARWLGEGMIAVSGTDYSIVTAGGEERVDATPSGLELIETRSWTSRTEPRREQLRGRPESGDHPRGDLGCAVRAQPGARPPRLRSRGTGAVEAPSGDVPVARGSRPDRLRPPCRGEGRGRRPGDRERAADAHPERAQEALAAPSRARASDW